MGGQGVIVFSPVLTRELWWWGSCGERYKLSVKCEKGTTFNISLVQSLIPWGHCWQGDEKAR